MLLERKGTCGARGGEEGVLVAFGVTISLQFPKGSIYEEDNQFRGGLVWFGLVGGLCRLKKVAK